MGAEANDRSTDMRILESFIRGKNPEQSLCEDGIFIGAKIAAIIDGVTSKGTLSRDGGSSGRFTKEVFSGL